MTHHTFDRFQGVWLGGLFGQARVNRSSPRAQLSFDPAPDWIEQRRQLTEILLDPQESVDRNEELFQYIGSPLSILPWILLSEPVQSTIGEVYANSPLASKNITDSLIWSCLLSWLLHAPRSPFDKLLCHRLSDARRVSDPLWGLRRPDPDKRDKDKTTETARIVGQKAIRSAGVNDILIEKLDIAMAAVESGTSIHQLATKLISQGNKQQTAIALSYYCFATTPQDFSLSITKAVNLDAELALLTAPLTGTLSGAYNGMTAIPGTWRIIANRSSIYRRESKLAVKLFQNWLGLYQANRQQFSDRELDAVALPQLIQPRQSLKIISQPRFSLD